MKITRKVLENSLYPNAAAGPFTEWHKPLFKLFAVSFQPSLGHKFLRLRIYFLVIMHNIRALGNNGLTLVRLLSALYKDKVTYPSRDVMWSDGKALGWYNTR
jgi:hypothetical protein